MTRRERKRTATLLDQFVPLRGASHRDVVDYRVTVPRRFAEVEARLVDGRTARLSDPRKFLGWRGYGSNPTLLLDCGNECVVVNTGNDNRINPMKFITPDGGQTAWHPSQQIDRPATTGATL